MESIKPYQELMCLKERTVNRFRKVIGVTKVTQNQKILVASMTNKMISKLKK